MIEIHPSGQHEADKKVLIGLNEDGSVTTFRRSGERVANITLDDACAIHGLDITEVRAAAGEMAYSPIENY